MRWQQKWLVACILTVGIIGMVQMEERDGGNSQIRSLFEEGKDIHIVRSFVMSLMDNEVVDEVVTVSVAIHPSMTTYESLQPYEDGVIVSYKAPVKVIAREDGLILYTGHTRHTGKTMTVLYESGDTVTYGFVENFSHLPYTAVSANDLIAEVQPGPMYVQVESSGQFLDASALTDWISDVIK
ncbi:MAG: hypothetical protein ACE3JQ_08690 [Paenisporosarcina sp.]